MNGKGRIEIKDKGIKDGKIYQGKIEKNIMERGLIYEGTFVDGFNGGSGIIYYPDGTKAKGRFSNGNLIPLEEISD